MMRWYFQKLGGHTHVRVFLNGAKCGDLVFRNKEFEQIISRQESFKIIEFIEERPIDWEDAAKHYQAV